MNTCESSRKCYLAEPYRLEFWNSRRYRYRWESTDSRSKLLLVSIGITFTQFCVIFVWSLIKPFLSAGWRCRRDQDNDVIDDDDIAHERIEDPELEPLINDTPRPITMPASAKYTK